MDRIGGTTVPALLTFPIVSSKNRAPDSALSVPGRHDDYLLVSFWIANIADV
jgi:hypothetical protein